MACFGLYRLALVEGEYSQYRVVFPDCPVGAEAVVKGCRRGAVVRQGAEAAGGRHCKRQPAATVALVLGRGVGCQMAASIFRLRVRLPGAALHGYAVAVLRFLRLGGSFGRAVGGYEGGGFGLLRIDICLGAGLGRRSALWLGYAGQCLCFRQGAFEGGQYASERRRLVVVGCQRAVGNAVLPGEYVHAGGKGNHDCRRRCDIALGARKQRGAQILPGNLFL